MNKQVQSLMNDILLPDWKKVSHERFHETFRIADAEIFASYTSHSNNEAMTVFSMNGIESTHKTEHDKGLNSWPSFYINVNAKSKGLVSLTADQLKGE